MKNFEEIKHRLVDIDILDLFNYVGYPILMLTPQRVYACGSDGCKKACFDNGYDEEWVVFDGNILLNEGTRERTYWTFKCL